MVHLIILNKKDYSMSLFPRGTATHSWVVVCTQTCISINMGRELNKSLILMPAQPTPELLMMEMRVWLSTQNTQTSAVPCPEKWLWEENTSPSAMNSCLGLKPIYVLYTLTLEYPNPCWHLSWQAGGNQGRKIQVFVDSSSGADCFSRKALFSNAAAWFSLPSSYTTLALFCVWSVGATNITGKVDGAPGRECLSIPSQHNLENGSYTHVRKKGIMLKKNQKTEKPGAFLKNPKPASQIQKFPAAGLIKMVLWVSHPKLCRESFPCCLFRTGWEALNHASYRLCCHQIKGAVAGLRDVLWCFLQIWILISCSYFQGAKEYYILTNTSFQAETHSFWHSKTCQEKHLGGKKFYLYDLYFFAFLQALLNLKIQSCSLKTSQITS